MFQNRKVKKGEKSTTIFNQQNKEIGTGEGKQLSGEMEKKKDKQQANDNGNDNGNNIQMEKKDMKKTAMETKIKKEVEREREIKREKEKVKDKKREKEENMKHNKLNKGHMLLNKKETNESEIFELKQFSESLYLFDQLKSYLVIQKEKNFYEHFTEVDSSEHSFSSIIITPLNVLPNVVVKKYFGVISLHLVKENINLKNFDFFYQSLISDITFLAKSHISAMGANLISSFKITNLFLKEEKSHAYALISICGDVAKI